jgi:hypothetical protein
MVQTIASAPTLGRRNGGKTERLSRQPLSASQTGRTHFCRALRFASYRSARGPVSRRRDLGVVRLITRLTVGKFI